ncbi:MULTISPECIES: MFS transporter [unclassified Pseudomonas]|uniref:MFS transporter n=1 Tax=unclassified Pseudomonas TaxID=196821 RepID=UPI0030DADBAD
MVFNFSHYKWLLIGSAFILALSLGVRHGFGLFLAPMSLSFGWGREIFAFAIAFQNLIWGIAQPFSGALADRYGAGKVIAGGGFLYACGLVLMSTATSSSMLLMSAGVLVGIGLSGTTFSVILGVIGRALPIQSRSMGMGLASAAGSLGQFVMLPGTLELIQQFGWQSALIILAGLVALILPLVGMLKDRPLVRTADTQTAGQALQECVAHRGFILLSAGFFVCGFQVVFIGIHLPSYIIDQHLDVGTGTAALALIGLFNIFGTYTAGIFGARYSKPRLLTMLYALRAIVIACFIAVPVTKLSVYCFSIAIGFLWLSTVPLTNGTIASVFGVRNLSMLGGIVYFFHQVGAFFGGWLGGLVYDRTGSYDLVWYISIVLSVIATVLHWPITESPVERRPRAGEVC